jgi:hypothetical protein
MAAAQARGATPAPIGIIFNTSISRPDSALALGALYSSASRGDLRVTSLCVTGAGLGAAIFCDIVMRFYVPRVGGSNTVLPIGLAAGPPLAPDPPMVKAAIERKKPNGERQYARVVERVTDTALAEAVLRNATTLTTQAGIILSGPATSLARDVELAEARAIFQQRVKRLVIVDTGAPRQDAAALQSIVKNWPTPIFFIGPDVGHALPFPGARLDQLFAWAPAHPVADAYRAFKTMPYDAPAYDLAAVSCAVDPDADGFMQTASGMLSVGSDGRMAFTAGAGPVRRIAIDPAKQPALLERLVTTATQAPAPPPARGKFI